MNSSDMHGRLTMEYLKPSLDKALLVPPTITRNPSLWYWPKVDDLVMSGSIARTPGGRIFLTWHAGGDNAKSVLLIAHSDDNGKTFSDPEFIADGGYADPIHHMTAMNGVLDTAPDGRLFFFFGRSWGYFDGRAGIWCSICENPDDDIDKVVWSEPKRIANGYPLTKMTILSDGTWLLAASLWPRYMFDDCWLPEGLFSELDGERMANVLASKDQGKTWTRIGGVKNIYPTYDEPMILERKDGSLLMYIRSVPGVTYSESFDKGRTWTQPKMHAMPTASARFFLRRLQSGRVLYVTYANPEHPETRSHLTACLSEDDGLTWKSSLLLDERAGISYPDGFQAPDGRIFLEYDHNRWHGEIMLAAFREEDILAGKIVSEDSFLKHSAVETMTCILEKQKAK